MPDAVANFSTEIINALLSTGDDELGLGTYVLQPNAFASFAQQPLTHFRVQLDYHFFLQHTDGDAKYYSFYQIVEDGSAVLSPSVSVGPEWKLMGHA
ncbi:hypothetical protein [Nodosilinea sp. FACHB-13]|uniref:hypothetical protein n=1 Tax=Cyanophyceae TaxID=3028117 RepID=UPI001686D2C3|nr:hypothetical protein [Nodosilinea sp. FACHB-13]MBD2108165.1 hypothetical protein [Nodosilinea sp. FACHB-13]